MAAGMNIDALIEIFDQIVRKFWKSDEYNSRECRYWSYPYLKERTGASSQNCVENLAIIK